MNLFADRCATATAVIGVVLMICTILTRVNPVEASVVRPEFLRTPLGQPVAVFLLIASAPGWIGVLLSMPLTALVNPEIAIWTSSLLVQFAGGEDTGVGALSIYLRATSGPGEYRLTIMARDSPGDFMEQQQLVFAVNQF
jgi:hypothetical protein